MRRGIMLLRYWVVLRINWNEYKMPRTAKALSSYLLLLLLSLLLSWRWNGWMASTTQWTWVWASSGRRWWTGKPGMLQSMGSQSWTQLSNWTELNDSYISYEFVLNSSLKPRFLNMYFGLFTLRYVNDARFVKILKIISNCPLPYSFVKI